MVRVLVPTEREFEPEMDTFAFESAALAVSTTDETELGTLTVYETVPDEKAGVRVPEDNLIPERLLLDDSAVLLTTETLFDADGVPTLCSVSKFISSDVVTDSFDEPAALAVNLMVNLYDDTPLLELVVIVTVPPPPFALAPETNSMTLLSYLSVACTEPRLEPENLTVTVNVSPTVTDDLLGATVADAADAVVTNMPVTSDRQKIKEKIFAIILFFIMLTLSLRDGQ